MALSINVQLNLANKKFQVSDTTSWPLQTIQRNDLGLFLFVQRLLSAIEHVSAFSSQEPMDINQWEVDATKDGVYRFLLVALPVHNAGLTYTAGKLVYSGGSVYHAKNEVTENNQVTDPCWEKIDTYQKLSSLPSLSEYLYSQAAHFLSDQTATCLAEKALAYSKTCGCEDVCEKIEDYYWTEIFHNSASYLFQWAEYEKSGNHLAMAIERCQDPLKSPCNCH